ncbi:MAG: glycosyltransferase family 4 protein [Candidatus Buchananbacteria bacterium]
MNGIFPKNKKIVIFSAFYEPYMSGAEQMAKEIAERLGDRFEITLITSRIDNKLPKEEIKNGFKIVRVGFGSKFDKYFYPILAAVKVGQIKPSVIHAIMESYAGVALFLAKYLCPQSKRILTLQSGDLDHPVKQKKFLIRFFWKLIHLTPDKITAISNFLADRAKKLGVDSAKISILPNGVDLSKVIKNEKVPNSVLCVARLSWEKGLDYLIKAWPDVIKEVSDAKLVLVGEGDKRAEIEKLIADLNIGDSVELMGNLPHDQVLAEMSKSEIFVCPSLAEGLGIVFIEAQACALAVIGTKVGGIPDVIEDGVNGLLINSKSSPAISSAIIKLLKNKEFASSLSSNALETVKKFDWKNIISEVDNIYNNYINRRLKIIFASGIYPPQLGGPATFSHALANELAQGDFDVNVLTFGNGKYKEENNVKIYYIDNGGSIIGRYVAYFWKLFKLSLGADIIYALDVTSVGLPSAFVRLLNRKVRLMYRLGGDFQWEKALSQGKFFGTLKQYYLQKKFNFREKILYALTNFAIKRADWIVFNANFLKTIYCEDRNINADRQSVVKNIKVDYSFPEPVCGANNDKIKIIFAGRFVPVKNLINLVKAMAMVKQNDPLTFNKISLEIIGEGPQDQEIKGAISLEGLDENIKLMSKLSHADLMDKISQSDMVANVSLSEVNPNLIAEALLFHKKVVVTKESEPYYSDLKSPLLFFVDPLNVADMAEKIISSVNCDEKCCEKISAQKLDKIAWSKERVVNEHINIFNKLLSK